MVFTDVDWTHGAAHMLENHGVTVDEANEALTDPERVVINPDYNSKSGKAARVIGYSSMAARLLSIIVVTHDGTEYGANGWPSNGRDERYYTSPDQDGTP